MIFDRNSRIGRGCQACSKSGNGTLETIAKVVKINHRGPCGLVKSGNAVEPGHTLPWQNKSKDAVLDGSFHIY